MAEYRDYFFTFEPYPSSGEALLMGRSLANDTTVDCSSAPSETSSRDLAYTVSINILVFLTVAGISSVVDYDEFKASFKKPPIYAGAAFQFFLMPLVGFITVFTFPLDSLQAICLLILCASPGGAFSNWWCNLLNADLALSVSMTSLSTVASVAMLPFNVWLYITVAYTNINKSDACEVSIDFTDLGITLAIVITAIISGLTFGVKFPEKQWMSNIVGNACGFLSIMLGVFASTDVPEEDKPWNQEIYPLWIATAAPLIVGLIGTFALSGLLGLRRQQQVAIALETAYQNTSISLAYALSQGEAGRVAAAVPVIYGGYEAGFFGLFMLFAWQMGWTYAPGRPIDDLNWVQYIAEVFGGNWQPGSERFYRFFDPVTHLWRDEPISPEEAKKMREEHCGITSTEVKDVAAPPSV